METGRWARGTGQVEITADDAWEGKGNTEEKLNKKGEEEEMSASVVGETIQERFETWIERHPDVYTEFKRIAEGLLARKRAHYGAKAIMEVIRFHRAMSGQDEQEPFKVNNSYTSRLARKLMEEDDKFIGFFETRELRSE